ncbi:hypothetical protein [Actinotalea sp. JY-7876]|uniref:hypothetical protein n=1 Tax=Actinotalea sp. JY-7876 TaxID=2758442 RepID=UPI0015F74215|nr:hypothetical protein [Actinotalea sp. JY-7876]
MTDYRDHVDAALRAVDHARNTRRASHADVANGVATAQVHATLALAAAVTMREFNEPVPYLVAEPALTDSDEPMTVDEGVEFITDALARAGFDVGRDVPVSAISAIELARAVARLMGGAR